MVQLLNSDERGQTPGYKLAIHTASWLTHAHTHKNTRKLDANLIRYQADSRMLSAADDECD